MTRVDTFADPGLKTWPREGVFVLYDLEYTTWAGSHERNWSLPHEHREIVEIGALRLRIDSGLFAVEAEFEQLVSPRIHPVLSSYFSELTGIDQAAVDAANCDFSTAWTRFAHFCQPAEQIWCVGKDGEVLRENLILHGMSQDFPVPSIDIRPALARDMGKEIGDIVSCRLPLLLGLPHPERCHRALGDVHAVFSALEHLSGRRELT